MSLSILNNVAALYAQNNISSTQAGLQKTLQQLSSGSRINSGADDPSGLAVSDGLNANEAALTQSATNATEGIGLLQTADGALSQVTSLLDQAVSIATEVGGGTLTGDATTGQIGSANQEYSNILSQIADIGTSTNYNSNPVFTDNLVSIGVSDGTTTGTSSYKEYVGQLTDSNIGSSAASTSVGSVGSTAPAGAGDALVFTISPGSTVSGTLTITGGANTYVLSNIAAGTTMAQLAGDLTNDTNFGGGTGNAGLTVTGVSATSISISPSSGTETLANSSGSTFVENTTAGNIGDGETLTGEYATITTGNSKAVAQEITSAIAAVAYQRGTIGADINQLSSAASVASAEQVNLSSAQNSVSATDYGQAASNLSKYQILSQTGISALAQANSVQQEVLKLLQ